MLTPYRRPAPHPAEANGARELSAVQMALEVVLGCVTVAAIAVLVGYAVSR